jgi:hypothetical protein
MLQGSTTIPLRRLEQCLRQEKGPKDNLDGGRTVLSCTNSSGLFISHVIIFIVIFDFFG